MNTSNVNKQALLITSRVLYLQLLMGSVCLLVSMFIHNIHTTLSVLLGVGLVVVPTIVYVKISAMHKILPINQIYGRHKKAELVKFVLNLSWFALIFIGYKHVQAIALLVSYAVVLSSYWWVIFINKTV